MRYASVWNAVQIIQQLGKGTQLAKLDLHNAYRMVPVHPDDHCLLGVCWGEDVFVDTALPFELRSAPKISCPSMDSAVQRGHTPAALSGRFLAQSSSGQAGSYLSNSMRVERQESGDKQSLIGTLSHAATVVIPGQVFLRRMIDAMKMSQIPTPPCATEQGISVKHPMVGMLPPRLEWEVNSAASSDISHILGRFLQVLGMRNTQSQRGSS